MKTKLEIVVREQLGDTLIDVEIVTSANVIALLGLSGSGKTSIINIIPGF